MTFRRDSVMIGLRVYCYDSIPNIIKQCAFVHVGFKNITMGCPNLVQGDSN